MHYTFLNYSCLGMAYCVCLGVTFLPEIVQLQFLTCVMAGVRFGLCLTYVLVYFFTLLIAYVVFFVLRVRIHNKIK